MENSISINIQKTPCSETELISTDSATQMTEVCLENKIELKPTQKKAKRIVYFSDGAVEEFSDDEEKPHKIPTDKKPSTWSSYIIENLDNMGEKLAWFFGITSPKYQYAIDEYWRRKEEEEEDKEFEAREEAAKIERRGRRNVAMEREVSVVTVASPQRTSEDDVTSEATCRQPTSFRNIGARGGLVNEGFDDSFKY